MRFSDVWISTYEENFILKLVLLLLTVVVIVLSIVCIKLSLKPPLIIERSDKASLINKSMDSVSTRIETENFIREAIPMRFNSAIELNDTYLSAEEKNLREQEQKEFFQKNLSQRVFINSILIEENKITLDTDRLISVEQVRSAFSFPLQIELKKINRSLANPYGLVLVKTTTLTKKL